MSKDEYMARISAAMAQIPTNDPISSPEMEKEYEARIKAIWRDYAWEDFCFEI